MEQSNALLIVEAILGFVFTCSAKDGVLRRSCFPSFVVEHTPEYSALVIGKKIHWDIADYGGTL